MSINIAAIETDVANLFHSAVSRAQAFLSAAPAVVHTVVQDVDKAAAVAAPILAVFAPQDSAALQAVTGILNLVDGTVQTAAADASGGVTLTLPAELVALFKSAKDQLVKYESSL